jgi:hypothetical protein
MSTATFEGVVSRLGDVQRHGSPYDVRGTCPLCNTHALAVRQREGEPLLVHCHSCGAGFRDVLDRIGELPAQPVRPQPRIAERPPRPVPLRIGAPWPGTQREIIRAHGYEDETGRIRYANIRLTGDKDKYRPARPASRILWDSAERMLASTLWLPCRADEPRRLYREPLVRAYAAEGGTLYLVEGERDADTLNTCPTWNHRYLATTSGGTGSWRDEFAELLRGASEIRVLADPDPQGLAHARDLAGRLRRADLPVTLHVPRGSQRAQA